MSDERVAALEEHTQQLELRCRGLEDQLTQTHKETTTILRAVARYSAELAQQKEDVEALKREVEVLLKEREAASVSAAVQQPLSAVVPVPVPKGVPEEEGKGQQQQIPVPAGEGGDSLSEENKLLREELAQKERTIVNLLGAMEGLPEKEQEQPSPKHPTPAVEYPPDSLIHSPMVDAASSPIHPAAVSPGEKGKGKEDAGTTTCTTSPAGHQKRGPSLFFPHLSEKPFIHPEASPERWRGVMMKEDKDSLEAILTKEMEERQASAGVTTSTTASTAPPTLGDSAHPSHHVDPQHMLEGEELVSSEGEEFSSDVPDDQEEGSSKVGSDSSPERKKRAKKKKKSSRKPKIGEASPERDLSYLRPAVLEGKQRLRYPEEYVPALIEEKKEIRELKRRHSAISLHREGSLRQGSSSSLRRSASLRKPAED